MHGCISFPITVPITRFQSPIANYPFPLPIANHALPIAHCQSPIANHHSHSPTDDHPVRRQAYRPQPCSTSMLTVTVYASARMENPTVWPSCRRQGQNASTARSLWCCWLKVCRVHEDEGEEWSHNTRAGAPSRGRAFASAGFVNLCWQPSGYALYNRAITT